MSRREPIVVNNNPPTCEFCGAATNGRCGSCSATVCKRCQSQPGVCTDCASAGIVVYVRRFVDWLPRAVRVSRGNKRNLVLSKKTRQRRQEQRRNQNQGVPY